MARISLLLADARSLKDKRMVIRRIKDRVRDRIGVFVNEVGSPEIKDSWRRGELGVAVASSDRQKALALIDEVVRLAMSAGGAQITAVAKDAVTFDAEAAPVGAADLGDDVDDALRDRTGSGDKAVAGDDWVPSAWRKDEP
ncbi:MAG TPA: DUF503 domain-containing protein [Kofleriaceae bacterium]|jgi:hypothetical protein|nr:DUF503 domain-containing protein [Kofleriaceae bacterium]